MRATHGAGGEGQGRLVGRQEDTRPQGPRGQGLGPLTVEAVGPEGAALGQHGQQRLLAEEQLADDAIAAPEAAATPRPQPQLEAAQDDWVPARGGDSVRPAPAPPRPRPAPGPGPAAAAHLLSRISGSVMRVLVMWLCTPLRPCQPGPAPAPPATVS